MILKEISDRNLFDAFVEKHPYCHYMKTSMWGEFKKKTEGLSYTMLGFYEDNDLAGTAMVLSGTWMMHKYLYVPWGPCIDYENADQVRMALTLLKGYADRKKVLFLRMDPNVLRCEHDILGNVKEDGINNEHVTEQLKSLGFTHKGYGYAYNGSWTNRYTLMVDLSDDIETVRKRYSKERIRALKRHKTWAVTTHVGSAADIPDLMKVEKMLTEQDGFEPHTKEFFQAFFDCFGDHAVLYCTDIDLDTMISSTEAELQGKKYEKDLKARESVTAMVERTKVLRETWGSPVRIACGLFIRFGNKSWDLYTYNHKAFNHIRPVDNLHSFAMEDMKNHGVTRYDMVGFSGVTTKDDPEYGLYQYKASFGPEYIERIGEFDYVRNENAMKRFRFEKLAVNHVKRKIWRMKYQKKDKE